MELTQNLWERYGFTDNPYDTKALSLSKAAVLSVQDAYIGRAEPSKASALLTNFLRNPGGGRIIEEGDVSHLPDSFGRSLTFAEALSLLRAIATSEIRTLIHGAEADMFQSPAEMGQFTNSSLVGRTGKSKQLVQKYLQNWRQLNLVLQGPKQGRNQIYEVEPRFSVLNGAHLADSHSHG